MSATILQFPAPESAPERAARLGPLAVLLWLFTVLGMAFWGALVAAASIVIAAALS